MSGIWSRIGSYWSSKAFGLFKHGVFDTSNALPFEVFFRPKSGYGIGGKTWIVQGDSPAYIGIFLALGANIDRAGNRTDIGANFKGAIHGFCG